MQVKVESNELGLRVARDTQLRTGMNLTLEGDANTTVKAGTNMTLQANGPMLVKGATAEVAGAGQASLTGPLIRLGCANRPAARLGDQVNTAVSPAVIAQGSPTVLVC
jgi:hypothetical protein